MRIVADERADSEDSAILKLRPRDFNEYVGQQNLMHSLKIAVTAAVNRGEPVDHVLFHGPPGLGKTTLAHIIAREMNVRLEHTSGPALERPADMVGLLSNLESGAVLFIDEIHRLARAVEEVLYPAMEDFALDIILGKGPAARSIRLELPPFTLVGATTRTGLITGPLRDRFGLTARLEYYEPADLQSIVTRAAGILDVDLDEEGAAEIARRSRGTPRIGNRLLRQVRDFAQVERSGVVDGPVARDGLAFFGVDDLGLDKPSREILSVLCRRFDGGPVGLKTLSISVSESEDTVEDVYEPYLIQQGLLHRTPKGRVATTAAYDHLGINRPAVPERRAGSLFED